VKNKAGTKANPSPTIAGKRTVVLPACFNAIIKLSRYSSGSTKLKNELLFAFPPVPGVFSPASFLFFSGSLF